jgi:signal transduction histidine kinase
VQTHDDGIAKPLDPAVGTVVFRAVRELLINVAKHAKVSHATVHIEVKSEKAAAPGRNSNILLVTVTDDGAGFDPENVLPANGPGGFGLISVRQRLALLGGELTIRSNLGDGTSVILKAPLLQARDGTANSTGETQK